MTNDELYLSVYLAQSNRTVVLEGDGFSVWIYVLNQNQDAVEFSGILCSLGKLSTEPEEVQRFAQEGNQPPLLAAYASPYAVLENLDQEDIRVEELDQYTIVVYVDDEPYAQVQPQEKLVFTKALKEPGPYGEPLANARTIIDLAEEDDGDEEEEV